MMQMPVMNGSTGFYILFAVIQQVVSCDIGSCKSLASVKVTYVKDKTLGRLK
jgi:hypothetical protein